MENGTAYTHNLIDAPQHHCIDASLPDVTSLPTSRILFNLLDTKNVGLVPLSEIERRWKADAVPNLPGVLEALRTASPAGGMISYETFDWSLRFALARVQRKKNEMRYREMCRHNPAMYMQSSVEGRVYQRRPNQVNNEQAFRPSNQTNDEVAKNRAETLARLKQENNEMLMRLANANVQIPSASPLATDRQVTTIEAKGHRSRTKSGPVFTSKIMATLKRGTQKQSIEKKGSDVWSRAAAPSKPLYSSSSSGRGSATPPPTGGEEGASCRLFIDVDAPGCCSKPISLKRKTYIGLKGVPRLGDSPAQLKTSTPDSRSKNHSNRSSDATLRFVNGDKSEEVSPITKLDVDQRRGGVRKGLQPQKQVQQVQQAKQVVTRRMTRPKSTDPDSLQGHLRNSVEINGEMKSKRITKRHNPRRHTLSNDIDIIQLGLIRKLDREVGVLQQSIEALGDVSERLHHRLADVMTHTRHHADKQANAAVENFQLSDEKRLNMLLSVVGDLTLMSRDLLYPDATDILSKCKVVQKEDNWKLVELLEEKSAKIKSLEQEKAILIQEMFKLKSPSKLEDDTSIFI